MSLRRLVAALALAVVAAVTTPAVAAADTVAARNPVVVVTGLSGIAADYEPFADRLRYDGYHVYVFQLPNLGFGDIRDSAKALADFVGQVEAASGSSRVDLIGHSEGGLASRYFLKFLGGTGTVDRYISLGTPQYGTYVANITAFLGLGDCVGIIACQQMTIGSDFLATLNSGDDAPGLVHYTTVRTLGDELVRPVDNAELFGGATNVLVQALCPLRVVGHVGLILDGTVYTIVRSALAGGPIWANCFAL